METTFPVSTEPPAAEKKLRFGRFRPWVSAVLSILVTGLGQTFNRQPAKGITLLLVGSAFYWVIGWFGLWRTFVGLVLSLVLQLAYVVGVVFDAFRTARRQVQTGVQPKAPFVLYALALILVVAQLGFFNVEFVANFLLHMRAFRIPADSMKPTLVKDDRLIADMRAFADTPPARGDVVVFTDPNGQNLWVKRVIGVPGDEIAGDAEQIVVNGRRLDEPYVFHAPDAEAEAPTSFDGRAAFGPIRVPEGKLFLAGDNRNHSFDSRFAGFGLVDIASVKGKPLYLYYSTDFGRIGRDIR